MVLTELRLRLEDGEMREWLVGRDRGERCLDVRGLCFWGIV